MQVIETSSNGLKRELKVVVGASELGDRFEQRLAEIKDTVQIKGFRKGKVPVGHLKKVFGRQLMVEVVQKTVEDTSRKAIEERKERPAMQPKIALPEKEEDIESVIGGKADLAYDLSFEVLPEIAITSFESLKLERLKADVAEAEVEKAIGELAERNVAYVAEEGRGASDKDRVTIDFIGRIGGEAFEGGTAEGVNVIVGAGNFIPGFEDGLKGAKAGETRTIKATFPEAYQVETLKGKEAEFETTIKEVARPETPAITDDFAKTLGAESLERLRELVKAQIQREYDQASRQKLKRQLLDALDTSHDFPLPPSLVDAEFEGIWREVTRGLEQAGKTFADEGKTEESAREEYRKIAERRVRLGLVIGEVGDKNKIEVTQDELRRMLIEQARRFPGQERMVYEYYEKTPGALAELRAPIFEDKVVDLILAAAKPSEKSVSPEELLKPEEAAA